MKKEDSEIKILVVDDMPVMRRMIINLLLSIGFRNIQQAEDGKSALAKLQVGRFDLLVTDWHMPSMSGIELVKAVRSDPELKHMYILMVTAQASREAIIEAAKVGINGYVVKPFTAATLKGKIEKILARQLSSSQD